MKIRTAMYTLETTRDPTEDLMQHVGDRLLEQHPEIVGYQTERTSSSSFNLMVWGEITDGVE